jgi:hypothetical protein
MEWPPIAGDPRFFQRSGPHSLAAVVDAAEANAPPRRLMLTGVAPLQTAEADQVSFLGNRKYVAALDETRAGAVIVHPDMAERVPPSAVAILADEPYAAWARVAALFHPCHRSGPACIRQPLSQRMRWSTEVPKSAHWPLSPAEPRSARAAVSVLLPFLVTGWCSELIAASGHMPRSAMRW